MAADPPSKLSISGGVSYAPLAILACMLWASAFGAMKIGLAYVPALPLASMRYILACILLVPLWARRGRPAVQVRRSWPFILLVSLVQTVIVCGVFTIGMQWAQGAQGAILVGASPLIAALTAHFLMPNDRMDRAKAGLILLGLIGVVIIILGSKPWEPTGLRELFGMGLLLAAVASSGLGNVLIARRRRRIDPLLLNSLQMGAGGVVLGALAVIFGELPVSVPPVRFFIALGYMSVVSATAFSIWFYLLRRVQVSRLNMWKFLIPVFGAIVSWIIVPGESPTASMLAGMAIVAAAVLLNARQSPRVEDRPVG